MSALRSAEIHARVNWPEVLERLGVDACFLCNRHGPCPSCGGRDRFRFDNKGGRGTFYCNQCGPGDGFALLMKVRQWTFTEARRRVMEAAGIGTGYITSTPRIMATTPSTSSAPATPTARVNAILRSTCDVADCAEAVDYLGSRGLWPLPQGCTLRAHPSVDYFDNERQQRLGRFAALVAAMRDIQGEPVTAHITYLQHGQKLAGHEPRKIMSPLTGRAGCAVRLLALAGDTLGIGEGIETCLAAAKIYNVPAWAALNTTLLAKFEPPEQVRTLVIFADRDSPGLEAAARLMQHLQGRVRLDLRVPEMPFKDFNDVLMKRSRGQAIG